jgi:hypothetical protein
VKKHFGASLVVAALAGGVVVGPPSVAAPPTTVTQYDAGLECTGVTTGGDAVRLTTGTSAQFGDSLFAVVGPEEDPRASVFSVSGGWTGDTISFVLEVHEGGGGGHLAPVGGGTFTASVDSTVVSEHTERGGSGNQHVRSTIVTSALVSDDARLTIDGFTVRALACTGSSTLSTHRSSSPASTVRFERRFYDRARCDGNAVVGLFGPEDGDYYLSVEVGSDNDQRNLFGVVPEPKGDRFTVVLPLRDSETGEVLGEHEVTVTLSQAEAPVKSLLLTSRARVTQTATLYDVRGQVSLPGMRVDSTCQALEVVTREIVRPANGPKPGGRKPTNDTVDGAPRLSPGTTARSTNRGAAVDPETPMTCATDPGRTLWWTFVGTGRPVRLDTAGSRFDTAIAVYEPQDGRLRQVACNDDIDPGFPYPKSTLQARVELPTVKGRVYSVQVGGVFSDFGRLVLSMS